MVINIVYFVILRKNSSDTHDHSVFFFMLAVLDIIYGAVLIVIFTQKLIEMGMSTEFLCSLVLSQSLNSKIDFPLFLCSETARNSVL